ncbi:MAG: extracellular elastinolytic metalloproteinase, partial [Gaiellaceae bacterium]|nr:extracellular elastinolytic metalloproteinase [Gaiellaceae bacterium]
MRNGLLAVLGLLAVPITAQAVTNTTRIGPADGNTDVRTARPVAAPNPGAVAALRARLGADAVVSLDERNGALRMVGRLNGFLTGASTADAAAVALGYVRANRAAFGLTAADIDGLVLVRRVTTVGGLQRLFWQQRVQGIPALDSGLRANVTADGRLVNVAGSPVSGVSSVRVTPRLSAAQARAAALAGVGVSARPSVARPTGDTRSTTKFSSGDSAALGVLAGATKRLVWDTTVKVDASHTYRAVVDAATGRTLLRRNLVQHIASERVHFNYPGAADGGARNLVHIPPQWVASTTALTGPNVHAFADLNDNDIADAGEETPPSTPPDIWNFPLITETDHLGGGPAGACTATFICTWDPTDVTTATQNQDQNVAQVFYFVNNFHDWLARTPFGFTAANGNFEVGDPVAAHALDGAGAVGGPDGNHVDNANMSTPADGTSPTMQMYLFHPPAAPWGFGPGEDPFLPSNGGDDASIIYHEYTHGLSNRLV